MGVSCNVAADFIALQVHVHHWLSQRLGPVSSSRSSRAPHRRPSAPMTRWPTRTHRSPSGSLTSFGLPDSRSALGHPASHISSSSPVTFIGQPILHSRSSLSDSPLAHRSTNPHSRPSLTRARHSTWRSALRAFAFHRLGGRVKSHQHSLSADECGFDSPVRRRRPTEPPGSRPWCAGARRHRRAASRNHWSVAPMSVTDPEVA